MKIDWTVLILIFVFILNRYILDAYNAQCRVLKISQNKSGPQNGLPNIVEELEPEKPESRTQEHYKKYRIKAFSASFVICLFSRTVFKGLIINSLFFSVDTINLTVRA